MNTFDEYSPKPDYICENCWQRVPMLFTYGDSFWRCLSCHQSARVYYTAESLMDDDF